MGLFSAEGQCGGTAEDSLFEGNTMKGYTGHSCCLLRGGLGHLERLRNLVTLILEQGYQGFFKLLTALSGAS